jgi:hypothetical protein
MKQVMALFTMAMFGAQILFAAPARCYVFNYTVPSAGGCPQPNHQNVSGGAFVNRRWSTSLPPAVLTVAPPGTPAQLDEIEQTILQSFGVWTGVTGSLLNTTTNPNAIAPIARTPTQNSCENDQGSNIDGLNTICFNQSSSAFTFGVLAFTRTVVADAPGQSVGSSGPSVFAGQILDADILFRPDGQATFATPGTLSSSPGAYDLESLLAHELGHLLGLGHSGIWRAMMFPFAPPPGAYLGDRPTTQTPDGPLADDDRVGLRTLYFDPSDSVDVGAISGRVLPANPFALATVPAPSAGKAVTGIFGAQVVAVDAGTGAVVAGTLGGWTCNAASPPAQFDGSFRIEHLPVGRNYKIYVEPLDGILSPSDFSGATRGLCRTDVSPPCSTPAVNTNFNTRVRPPSP